MYDGIRFEMVEDRKTLAEIVEITPSYWDSIGGELFASKSLYEEGLVAENTMLSMVCGDVHSIYGRVTLPFEDLCELKNSQELLRQDFVKPEYPDMVGILLNQKLFSSCSFNPSIQNYSPRSWLEEIKGLIVKGYKGIVCIADYYHDYGIPYSVKSHKRSVFCFDDFEKEICVLWSTYFDGRGEGVSGLIKNIKKLGLKGVKFSRESYFKKLGGG